MIMRNQTRLAMLTTTLILAGIVFGTASVASAWFPPHWPPPTGGTTGGTTTGGGTTGGGTTGGTTGGGAQSAPEPATLVTGLIGAGLAGFWAMRRKKHAR